MLPAFLGKDLLCFGKYLRTSFLIAHVFFFFFVFWVSVFVSFPLLFHLFSLCLGYSRLACSLKWCEKITLMAAVRHFGILPAKYAEREESKKCLTFSHSAGQLKRHNACTAAKSLTWPTCSGIFNLCAMRLHTLVCTLRALCTLCNMQYACNKVWEK